MQASELARRYARAVLAAAGSDDDATAALADLRFAAEVLARAPAWEQALSDPLRPAEERSAQARAALEPHIGPLALRLLEAAIRKRRLPLLPEIVRSLESLLDERHGILRVRLTSARPMTEERRRRIECRLAERAGARAVRLEVEVDPALLGGCVIRVGDRCTDGSCRGRLETLRERVTRD
jgi:F-type H+-transporting ATPase subunit delta